jgi:hypothetical protein
MRKNIVLSKSLVGIRMPRAVRNGLVIAFLNSAAGRALVAEAFVLAARVFGPRKLRASVKSRKGQDARVTVKEARARLSYACLKAMKAFRAALAEGDRVIDQASVESLPAPARNAASRKKLPRRRTGRTT